MGKRELRGVHDKPPEVDEVDVDRARAVSDGPHAPHVVLYRVHPIRKLPRGKRGPHDEDAVQELPVRELRRNAHRLGLLGFARRRELGRGKRAQRCLRAVEVFRARLDVRSEAEHYAPVRSCLAVIHPVLLLLREAEYRDAREDRGQRDGLAAQVRLVEHGAAEKEREHDA